MLNIQISELDGIRRFLTTKKIYYQKRAKNADLMNRTQNAVSTVAYQMLSRVKEKDMHKSVWNSKVIYIVT